MVLPSSFSFFRKRFRSRNLGVRISSLRWANQLSWRVSISSFRRSRCSSVSLATHFALSKLVAGAGAADDVPDCLELEETVFGAPKNEVMLALALGFFASAAARSAALRLRLDAMVTLSMVVNRDTATQ